MHSSTTINTVINPPKNVAGEVIPWYKRLQLADVYGSDIDNRYFIQAFTTLALQDHKTFVTSQFEGILHGGNDKVKSILDGILASRGGFIAAQYTPFTTTNNYRNWQYFWDDGVVTVTYSDDDSSVTIFALNEADRNAIVEAIRPITAKKRSSGKAYVMVSSSSGLQLKSLGNSEKVIFEPGNYSQDTTTKYRYAVEQLKSNKPNGRIMILRGEVGCGKTYLIRSLVGEVEHATFILVPSAMVSTLDGPDVLGTLINTYTNADGPICIILEDADSVLAPRKSDNMHSISTLLNVSDGILGNLMDLRIICTTNALQEDLDPAVVRDGRLCVDMEFDALPYEQATTILHRLTGKNDAQLPENKPYTLAQIYKISRPDSRTDIKLTSPKRQVMGFMDDEEETEPLVELQSDVSVPHGVIEVGDEDLVYSSIEEATNISTVGPDKYSDLGDHMFNDQIKPEDS